MSASSPRPPRQRCCRARRRTESMVRSKGRTGVGTGAPRTILVLSPWGLEGGYSGPLTLLGRLFEALHNEGVEIDVIYRDRGVETQPGWLRRGYPISVGPGFSRWQQIRWGVAAGRLVRRIGAEYD